MSLTPDPLRGALLMGKAWQGQQYRSSIGSPELMVSIAK
jgi:hypothetical protein